MMPTTADLDSEMDQLQPTEMDDDKAKSCMSNGQLPGLHFGFVPAEIALPTKDEICRKSKSNNPFAIMLDVPLKRQQHTPKWYDVALPDNDDVRWTAHLPKDLRYRYVTGKRFNYGVYSDGETFEFEYTVAEPKEFEPGRKWYGWCVLETVGEDAQQSTPDRNSTAPAVLPPAERALFPIHAGTRIWKKTLLNIKSAKCATPVGPLTMASLHVSTLLWVQLCLE